MTPNLIMNLDIEPLTFLWNGQAISLPGTYELVPDNEIKHLHKRVVAVALHERRRVPLYGRVVGKARCGKHSVWLIEDDNGNLVKAQKPMEI